MIYCVKKQGYQRNYCGILAFLCVLYAFRNLKYYGTEGKRIGRLKIGLSIVVGAQPDCMHRSVQEKGNQIAFHVVNLLAL